MRHDPVGVGVGPGQHWRDVEDFVSLRSKVRSLWRTLEVPEDSICRFLQDVTETSPCSQAVAELYRREEQRMLSVLGSYRSSSATSGGGTKKASKAAAGTPLVECSSSDSGTTRRPIE